MTPKYINGLLPAIIQDALTLRVIMHGFIDEDCLELTTDSGVLTMPSPYTPEGDFSVRSIEFQDDGNAVLIKVLNPDGFAYTSFGEDSDIRHMETDDFLFFLEKVIRDRKEFPVSDSYTNRLFDLGTPRIAQKVGEEAVETVIAAMGDRDDLFLGECADLMYHFLVLLCQKDKKLEDVLDVLKQRHSR